MKRRTRYNMGEVWRFYGERIEPLWRGNKGRILRLSSGRVTIGAVGLFLIASLLTTGYLP